MGPTSTKIEFAVQMTCDSCVDAVNSRLKGVPGISSVDINLESDSVVVETTLPTLEVQKRIEDSGRKAVVRGFAGGGAGVAILETGTADIKGVVRFVQVTPKSCVIDGTIDGIQPDAEYQLEVHECGDISQGCQSVGPVFKPSGNLGTVKASAKGRLSFRLENDSIFLPDIHGRSLVLAQGDQKLSCGIIARSAGLFENPKTICACDGLTIWNEKIDPKKASL